MNQPHRIALRARAPEANDVHEGDKLGTVDALIAPPVTALSVEREPANELGPHELDLGLSSEASEQVNELARRKLVRAPEAARRREPIGVVAHRVPFPLRPEHARIDAPGSGMVAAKRAQRARAAFRAARLRCAAVSARARAGPPLSPPKRPRATAAGCLGAVMRAPI